MSGCAGFLAIHLPGGCEGQDLWGTSWTIHHSFAQAGSDHCALAVRAVEGSSTFCQSPNLLGQGVGDGEGS